MYSILQQEEEEGETLLLRYAIYFRKVLSIISQILFINVIDEAYHSNDNIDIHTCMYKRKTFYGRYVCV